MDVTRVPEEPGAFTDREGTRFFSDEAAGHLGVDRKTYIAKYAPDGRFDRGASKRPRYLTPQSLVLAISQARSPAPATSTTIGSLAVELQMENAELRREVARLTTDIHEI